MLQIFRSALAPLVSLFLFTFGTGYFTTLTTIGMNHFGSSTMMIGLASSVFYLGLVLGSVRISKFIIRVGHIRAFATFASAFAALAILQGLWLNPYVWCVIRFFAGFVTVGLFVVIESWLLILSTPQTRGQALGAYMISYYLALSLSQRVLSDGTLHSLFPYAVGAMLCSLSVLPVSASSIPSPEYEQVDRLGLWQLFRASESGMVGSFVSGILLASLAGLLPLYLSKTLTDVTQVATVMALVIFGGMVIQYPLGRLSDMTDRRLVLIITSLGSLGIALVIQSVTLSYFNLLVALFFLGGFIYAMYPISIAYITDGLAAEDIVSGTQAALFVYSVGATVGPLLGSAVMTLLGHRSLFLFIAISCVLLTVFLSWRKAWHRAPANRHDDEFIPIPQTTPIVAELDPRVDENE